MHSTRETVPWRQGLPRPLLRLPVHGCLLQVLQLAAELLENLVLGNNPPDRGISSGMNAPTSISSLDHNREEDGENQRADVCWRAYRETSKPRNGGPCCALMGCGAEGRGPVEPWRSWFRPYRCSHPTNELLETRQLA